jgi:hypothetical protein
VIDANRLVQAMNRMAAAADRPAGEVEAELDRRFNDTIARMMLDVADGTWPPR